MNNEDKDTHSKVQAFAKDMFNELKANEPNKGTSWKTWDDTPTMIDELYYHEQKLFSAMADNDLSKIREHLADCGNLLMFIGNAYKLYE